MQEDPIKSFRSAFKNFLREENLEQTFRQKQLIADWESVMGRTIASRTTKLFFNKKTLFIQVSSAPLKNEMNNSKNQLLEILKKEIGDQEIEEIKIY